MYLKSIVERYNQIASEKILEYAPRVATAILVLFVVVIISMAVRRMIIAVANAQKLSGQKFEILKLIANSVSTTIIIIGVISVLGTLGVNISALVAGLGLSGFAVGFAMRDALSNLLSGILIILYQPFKVGDRIVSANFEGNVVEINLRYTVLKNEENKYLIPNANLFNNTVTVKTNKIQSKAN